MKCMTNAQIESLAVHGALIDSQATLIYAARTLVDIAAELGLVLTIEQQPLQPLAMGHYETVVTVRKARAP